MLNHAAQKMLLLLLKSEGQFKHSGKYFLHQGRWHKLHQDKPAPKGAAVAAHPHAAGAPVAKPTYTDEQWEQLKLPAENSNASTFNKQVDQLNAAAAAGDVTGILGSGYGTNTYGKKLAIIANHVLGMLGSTHTVTPGQKPGAHAAVQTAPEIEAGKPAKVEAAQPQAKPDVSDPNVGEKQASVTVTATKKVSDPLEGTHHVVSLSNGQSVKIGKLTSGESMGLPGWHNLDAPSGQSSYLADTKDGAIAAIVAGAKPASKPDQFPTFADHDAADAATDTNPEDAAPAADTAALSMPAFQEGKTVSGVVAYYEPIAQKVIDLASVGDVAALEQMKANGLKPNSKGKVSNTWAGKTPNSKMLLALHAQAMEHANAKPAESAKDEAIQAAVDHLKEDAKQGDLPAAEKKEDAELVQKLEAAHGDQNQIKNETTAASATETAPAAAEPAPIKKEPRLVIPKKAPVSATAPAASGNSKLDQIPWESLKLPDSNKNAKSNNKQVEKIKAMAYAGDMAGLEAFKAGKNTYGTKQNLLAQTALAALKEGGQPAPVAPKAAPPEVSPEQQSTLVQWLADGMPSNSELEGLYYQLTEAQKDHLAEKAGEILEENGTAGEDQQPARSKSLEGKPAYSHLAQAEDTVGANGMQAAADEWMAANPGAGDELNEALTNLGYSSLASYAAGDGPKDGDTKQGADGMLVFKNGRWHKQAEAKAADPVPAAQPAQIGVDAVQVPDFATLSPGKWGVAYKKVAEHLKQLVVAGGVEALKGVVINHQDGSFTIKAVGYNLKKVGPESLSGDLLANARRKAMHQFVTELKAAAGKPKKASKPKAASAPKPEAATAPSAAPSIESMDNWTQTGPQGGSNPGGRFQDGSGQEWYCKFPADEDMAKAEVLAAKLYAALGIAGQDAKLITKGGKVGIASKWTSVSKASSPAALAKVDGVASGFGADAWLGNWDVVGLAYDNLQIGADGKAHRVDAGGSLMYRAQGGKKAFGNIVTEIDSLRDPKINAQAAKVFGGMTEADITASVSKVINLPDASIRALCFQHGPGDEAARKALADTLIARKNDMSAKFPKAAKPKKKRLDPNNLPVDASQLPKRHDFSNWNGPGKGLSSQPHVNAANHTVEQEMFEVAKTGNLNKLKDFHFHEIDKGTGSATGKMIPIKNHPSKHVVQFHADLVQLLDEIANPPEPLKIFAETDVPTLDALAAAFPPKPFGTTVDSVKSNEKLGFWVVLGGASGVEKFKPKKVMDYAKAAIDAAYQKYKDAKPLAKHFINSVQASGSYNDLFRNGKEVDGHGNKLTDVAQAALEQATSMPEGTSVYRWQNMSDDMVKKIMSAPDGTVFQATGPMCTSYSPTATAGFGQHRVIVRYAQGAKAVESFGSGAFKGEKEVTTLPNSRFVILSKKMVPNEKQPGKQRLELEVLMLPPDLGIAGTIM